MPSGMTEAFYSCCEGKGKHTLDVYTLMLSLWLTGLLNVFQFELITLSSLKPMQVSDGKSDESFSFWAVSFTELFQKNSKNFMHFR